MAKESILTHTGLTRLVSKVLDKLGGKVDKVTGKGLSTNDYTTTEKQKLASVEDGANKYELPTATSSILGGVKSGGDVTINSEGVITINDDSHTHIINNIDGLQGALDAKVSASRTINGKVLSDDITLSASDVRADAAGTATSVVSTHNTSTSAHGDIRDLISGLTTRLNALADSDDTTLDQMSEVVAYIKSNKNLIDSITTSKVNVSDIINNLTTNVTNKPLSSAQGVALKGLIDALESELGSHGHAIADVSGLQSALDGKAATNHGNHVPAAQTASNKTFLRNDNTWATVTPANIGAAAASHGTHVSYATTTPSMDGSGSAGTASSVARSDHQHPVDTSRAAKTDFDSHDSNTTKHITSTDRINWNAAKTHADSAHAPSNAQANQNAFSNIAVSGQTTVAADTTTDTVTFVGSNVTITTDATNDKVTFSVVDGTTSAKGVVKLTNSTSSTSTTTAATPSSVKSAYDLANTAKTNAATAQSKADSAYTLAEGKVDSLSDLGITATATELNYVDGVTSNVQTQLNEKAWLSQAIANEGHTGRGETFGKDFLCVDLTNRLSTANQRAYWYKPDDTGWINVPSGLEGVAIGVREVFYYDKDHILVKITEFVPVQGRTWVNVYDYSWRGWKCYTDMSSGTLSSTANIDELSCGTYWCSLSSSNGGTIPVADYGVLEVMSNENSINIGNLQRFTTYSNGNKVYVRLRANGTWSSWKLLAVGDFLPLSGGTLTGRIKITNPNYSVPILQAWCDGEGSNLSWTDANGKVYEMDTYNGKWRMWTNRSGSITTPFYIDENGRGYASGSGGAWKTWSSGTSLTQYSDISIRVRVDSDARPSGTYVVVNIPTAMLSTATAQDDYFSHTVITHGATDTDNCFWGTLYVKVNAANNGITVTIDGLAHRLNGSPIIKVR